MKLTILGQPVSLKNRPILRIHNFRPHYTPNPQATHYKESFKIQASNCKDKFPTGNLKSIIHAYYRSNQPDLDLAIIYDCLQKSGIIHNDRQIREKHEFFHLDPNNPRAEIELTPIS